ncbi:hypothetical protein [Nonlabens ulvanivorans]|uniref:Uncharacterized protein n=2 Tax=Nonlabens ulvanivorans TaxID=906888 RepID=A0ABX5ED65_NONUL|nr:hypothetical protein [Nonlabens ulvanivorans]PRX15695.1 hypothetical protein LY02_00918 [Nonlabens ulvanivorans]
MKTMYRVNLVLIILNLFLFLIPFFGLLFMIPLGAVQVVCSLWLLSQYKRTSSSIQWMNKSHLLLTALTLGTMFLVGKDYVHFSSNMEEMVFILGMIISGLLGIYFMYISYRCYIENEEQLSLITK